MRIEAFHPSYHTPIALSEQLVSLPDSAYIVGSIGRCLVMGELKELAREDGTAVDVDIISTDGIVPGSRTATFRIDMGMTNKLRPVTNNEWGVFTPDRDEPFFTLDAELCQPVNTEVAWGNGGVAQTLSAAIQLELIGTSGAYTKNPEHIARFRDFVESQGETLPEDTIILFARYRQYMAQNLARFAAVRDANRLRAEYDLPITERLYRRSKRAFQQAAPLRVQKMVDRSIGPLARAIRGTK